MKNVILSPHRAAAVPGASPDQGHDFAYQAILEGGTKRMLKPADLDLVQACPRKSVGFDAEHIAMLNYEIIGTGNIARSLTTR